MGRNIYGNRILFKSKAKTRLGIEWGIRLDLLFIILFNNDIIKNNKCKSIRIFLQQDKDFGIFIKKIPKGVQFMLISKIFKSEYHQKLIFDTPFLFLFVKKLILQ